MVEKLSGIYLDDCFDLILLDVIFLFTNVSVELIVDGLIKR